MSDLEIIEAIRKNDSTKINLAYRYMYRNFYFSIDNYVRDNRGSEQDAKDVFQDIMIILTNNIRNEKYKNQAKLSSYLFGIAKNNWLNKLRRVKMEGIDRNENPMSQDIKDISQDTEREYSERQIAIGNLLKEAGDRCYELLKAFYYDRRSMTDIAQIMGFSSSDVAKNVKSRCIKKLKIATSQKNYYLENI